MKKIGTVLAVLVVLCVGLPQLANAVSPSPIPAEHEERIAKGIKVKGETVCLFQSGTPDVKKELAAGDILVVYRETGTHELKEVGMIRVLSFVRQDYLKGEVVEGEVQTGDIGKKGDVAGLVISSEDKCR